MTPRLKGLTAALAVAAALGIAAGCSNVDEEAAQTPDDAPTIANSAVQTDAEGNTVETEAPADTGGGGDSGDGGEEQVEAGLVVFQRSCTSCHLDDGLAGGGIGPQVAGMGLTPDGVRAQIVNGGAAMPAGLATGQDLDDVVAYVESLQ